MESTLLQLGVAGGALYVLYATIRPLIRGHLKALERFCETQEEMVRAIASLRRGNEDVLAETRVNHRELLAEIRKAV